MTAPTTGRHLFPPQRHQEILRLARARGRVDVASLATEVHVTTETVRRDLSDLQRRRLLRRVHGGAILWETGEVEPRLVHRDTQRVDEKRRIALAAVAELPPEGTVLLDSGSTTARVAERIPADSRLRIVTNSLAAARLLTEHESIELVVLGGEVDPRTLAMVDGQTVAAIAAMAADTVVLGADGISAERGVTTVSRAHADVKAAMVAAASRVVVVADHTKVGADQYLTVATCDQVDTVVTDDGVTDEDAARLEQAGPSVIRA